MGVQGQIGGIDPIRSTKSSNDKAHRRCHGPMILASSVSDPGRGDKEGRMTDQSGLRRRRGPRALSWALRISVFDTALHGTDN